MEAEVYDRNGADKLEQQIVARIGERQRKLERMAELEQAFSKDAVRPTLWVKRLSVVAAVAAMVTVAFVLWSSPQDEVSPLDALGIKTPYIDNEYRAAIPTIGEINQLMAEQNYAEALTKVETALAQSDSEIEEMTEGLTYMDDDELAYYLELEQNMNSELRWAYIYLLMREGQEAKARVQLKRYLKMPKYTCKHRDEAKALLNRMKNEK